LGILDRHPSTFKVFLEIRDAVDVTERGTGKRGQSSEGRRHGHRPRGALLVGKSSSENSACRKQWRRTRKGVDAAGNTYWDRSVKSE